MELDQLVIMLEDYYHDNRESEYFKLSNVEFYEFVRICKKTAELARENKLLKELLNDKKGNRKG